MQEASERPVQPQEQEAEEVGRKESEAVEAVNGWVQRVMLGSVSILITMLIAYIAWSIPVIYGISHSTKLLAADQSYAKSEISRLAESYGSLRVGLEQLTLQSQTWATRDQVLVTRDQLSEKITSIESQLHDLKLRVSLMENEKLKGR